MTDEEHLADLLLTWEDRFERGEVDLSAEKLCRERPELTAALASRIEALKKVAWVKTPTVENQVGQPPRPLGTEGSISGSLVMAGRYRLDERIAEGGFGEVWRGFDEELQRPVAVKLPKKRRSGAGDEEAFLAEARKVARLKHPGIVPVYDVGRHASDYFIVSDLIDGQDLGAMLREKPLALRDAVRVVGEAARHLHHAHEQDFVHRDIKPENILIDRHDKVYLTDFGIALTQEELALRGDDGCGTLSYMSPEQLHGDPTRIDARTDIYSLGVVLYQTLTGRLPFDAGTPEEIREQILRHEPAPPRSFQKIVGKEIERICLKCLSKSPANRYPTAVALSEDLARWMNRRKTNWLGVAVMVSIIVLCLLWLMLRGVPPTLKAPGVIASERLEPEEVLFNGRDLTGWVAFRPGGKEAFHVSEDGVLRLKGGPKGHLRTERTFADFVLRLEYMLPENGRVTAAGSGVLLRMTGADRLGAQYQEANIGKGNTGDLWWVAGRRQTRFQQLNEQPIGEWNEYVVRCEGEKLTLVLNGKVVNQVTGLEKGEGHIGIIAQGTDVWFRNIRVAGIRP